MNCCQAREGLWPPEQPRLAGADVVAARAHVEGCADCRAFFGQDRALLDAYHRLRGGCAPRDVRERVFEALARERVMAAGGAGPSTEPAPAASTAWRGWRRTLAGVAVAGGVAVAAAAVGLVPTLSGRAAPPEAFVHDYMRRAVGQDFLESSDPVEVRRFATRELGIVFEPMVLPGMDIERAEICLLDGRRGVVVVYGDGSASVSHYVMPAEGVKPKGPRLDDGARGTGERMPVVTWTTAGLDQALVGDVDAESLLWLARVGSGY